MFRNIFAFEDENSSWKSVLSQFENHVPRFDTKAEALEFTKQHRHVGSNPDFPDLYHSITTLICWEQIEKYLLPKIREYDEKWSANAPQQTSSEKQNHQKDYQPLYNYVDSRLNLKIHREMSSISRLNTLKYLFYHLKCGIYIMIRNNEVAIFCPFVNKDYRNTWNNQLSIENNTVDEYLEQKAHYFRHRQREQYLPMEEWWANGNIICNRYNEENDQIANQFWGDHFLLELKDMFCELCRCRKIPDCDFFINKRDYPQLKYNSQDELVMEPYGFIFDRDDRKPDDDLPLERQLYHSYAPIVSFYSSERFADIPIPPTEDWEAATGKVFPKSFVPSMDFATREIKEADPRDLFTSGNLKKFERPWTAKKPIALFRGSATGGGTTPETNQRVNIAQVSYNWSLDPLKNGSDPTINEGYPFLDAKLIGWNLRDKKVANSCMTYIKKNNFHFDADRKKNFIEIYKQSEYKYLLYIEGHCAACRYGFMMSLGSVIIKVESQCVASEMWYFPLLKPFVDHVPVKADLSDLAEKLQWCHDHDQECQQIANNARQFFDKYISRDGILDYLQYMCEGIAQRWIHLPSFVNHLQMKPVSKSVIQVYHNNNQTHSCTKDGNLCTYCQEAKNANEEMERLGIKRPAPNGTEIEETSKRTKEHDTQKRELRERMKLKAKLEREKAEREKAALE